MRSLTTYEVNFFNDNGYLIVPGALSGQTLKSAQEAYWRILNKCLNDTYLEYRVENQMSDDHIFGIERIFAPQIFEEAILQASIESGVLDYSKQLIQSDDVFILLNRIHCTNRFSYSGPWHRDGKISQTDHIQSGIFLFNEERFFVVPKTHHQADQQESEIKDQFWSRKHLKNQVCLSAKAGDLLLFHSSILHRGSCIGHSGHNRAYIHYRIGRSNAHSDIKRMPPPEYADNLTLNDIGSDWSLLFKRSMNANIPKSPLIFRPQRQNNLRGLLKKSFYRIAYYVLSFLPEDHSLFTYKPNFTPYLRANKT